MTERKGRAWIGVTTFEKLDYEIQRKAEIYRGHVRGRARLWEFDNA
jgi:hypothetical protein